MSSVLDCGQFLANTEICPQIFIHVPSSKSHGLPFSCSESLQPNMARLMHTFFFSFSVQKGKRGKQLSFRPLLLRSEMRTVRQWAKYCCTRHHSLLKLSLLLNPLQLLEIHKGGLGKGSLGSWLSMCPLLELQELIKTAQRNPKLPTSETTLNPPQQTDHARIYISAKRTTIICREEKAALSNDDSAFRNTNISKVHLSG